MKQVSGFTECHQAKIVLVKRRFRAGCHIQSSPSCEKVSDLQAAEAGCSCQEMSMSLKMLLDWDHLQMIVFGIKKVGDFKIQAKTRSWITFDLRITDFNEESQSSEDCSDNYSSADMT